MTTTSSNTLSVNTATPLEPGQIRFYNNAKPPLEAGSYLLQAQQSVEGLKSQPANNRFGAQISITLSGPRFRLPAHTIQLVYPPANQSGNYTESLPHIVLNCCNVPWIRTIDGSTATNATNSSDMLTPWIALLTLYPDEFGLPGSEVIPGTLTLEECLNPGNHTRILAPVLPDSATLTPAQKKSSLLALDMDFSLFRAIAPKLSELPFLAHARQVSTKQKEVMDMVEDGWFSVVTGNRLPKPSAENRCYLVSLEGHQDHLPDGIRIAPEMTTIRLICLASWKFTTSASPGNFLDHMQNVCIRGGIGLLQPAELTPSTPPSQENAQINLSEQLAKQALEAGYLPLQNRTRTGEVTTSWYRGPLSPVLTQTDPNGPYFYSDRAIRYDPETGLFNMAYACAWQIGRLLALSDAAFANALFQWRLTLYQKQQNTVATEHLALFTEEWNGRSTILGEVKDIQSDITPILLTAVNKLVDAVTDNQRPPIATKQPHHRRDEMQLPGILSVQKWFKGLEAGHDPLHLLHQHLYQDK